MPGFLVRLLITAGGLALASWLLSGIQIQGYGTLLLAAFLLGIVNAVVRPVMLVLTFPLTVMSLGGFLLVINAAMLGLVAWLLSGMSIASFWSALFGSIIVSITGWIANNYIGPSGRYEILVVDRRS